MYKGNEAVKTSNLTRSRPTMIPKW